MDNKKLYFSLFSGELYYINKDEVNTLDVYQIPLKCAPKFTCPKCYGRFYEYYNLTDKHYKMCNKCLKKCLDVDALNTKNKYLDEK